MNGARRITLPAGRYLIGDLCYQDDVWDEITESGDFSPFVNGVTSDGRSYAYMSTAYGDGDYLDDVGYNYYVDSGTIGIVSYPGDVKLSSPLGRTHDFPEPFEVYSEDGVLHFGHVVIDTAGSEEQDVHEE
jgi:hypothetical protein